MCHTHGNVLIVLVSFKCGSVNFMRFKNNCAPRNAISIIQDDNIPVNKYNLAVWCNLITLLKYSNMNHLPQSDKIPLLSNHS